MTPTATWQDWSCQVRLTVGRAAALPAARRRLCDLMDDVARSADRFSPVSDVSRVNDGGGRFVDVDRRTLTLVDVALQAAERSRGAVDPTVGAHLQRAGYDRDIAEVRERGPVALYALDARTCVIPDADWTAVRVDHTLRRIGVPVGMRLDLGATAKAWTADVAARQIAGHLDTAVLVEIGGDVSVAGSTDRPWQVTVGERSGEPQERVSLHHGGLTTSSTAVRRWSTRSGDAHHVIDPRSGLPADGCWRTATVWAPTAVMANTASTAALVLGEDAEAFLVEQGVAARLVDHQGRIRTVGGWPTESRAA